MPNKGNRSVDSSRKLSDQMPVTRRHALQGGAAALCGGLAGCIGGDDGGDGDSDLTEANIIGIDGGLNTMVLLWGTDNNVWLDRGIDVSLEISGVGRWRRCYIENECTGFGTQDTFLYPEDLAETDIKSFGGGLAEINRVFVREDSDIETPTDLEGKKFAATGIGAGTAQAYRAHWIDEYGFDFMEDTEEAINASSNAIYDQLVEGEIDAGLMFTGFTIEALVDDRLRSISYFADEWRDQTGYTPQVVYLATFGEFLEENPEDVANFWEGWTEAVDLWKNNFEEALQQYGVVGGVNLGAEDEFAEIERHLEEEELFPLEWDDGWIDAHLQLYEFWNDVDAVSSVPPRDAFVNPDDL